MLLVIPIVAIILEQIPQAAVVLGAIYILFSLLDNRRPASAHAPAKVSEEAAH